MANYQFTTTPEQEELITADALGKTKTVNDEQVQLTNSEYVATQVVDRFLAEITNRGEQRRKDARAEALANANPEVQAQINALLNP